MVVRVEKTYLLPLRLELLLDDTVALGNIINEAMEKSFGVLTLPHIFDLEFSKPIWKEEQYFISFTEIFYLKSKLKLFKTDLFSGFDTNKSMGCE